MFSGRDSRLSGDALVVAKGPVFNSRGDRHLVAVRRGARCLSSEPHRRRWLNRLLGTVAFLPCLHPFSFWEFGHNRVHHRFTNRRGKDYVWEPLSHAEFLALSTFQQLKYRFFRTAVGHYWYYLSEIWWKKMFFPRRRDVGRYTQEYVLDQLIVSTWLVIPPTQSWPRPGSCPARRPVFTNLRRRCCSVASSLF